MSSHPLKCRSLTALIVAISLSVPAACGEAGMSGDGWTVARDTLPNGALHVLHTPPAENVSGPIPVVEELRIGSIEDEGPTSFGVIKGVVALEDGRIVVLEAQTQEVRVFAPGGAPLATYGRQGQGPGEMESPYGLMLSPSGELWVPDHQNARMSVFDPDRGFDRSFPMQVWSYRFIWSGVMGVDGRVSKPSIRLDPRAPMLRVYDQSMTLVDSMLLPREPEFDREDPPGAFAFRIGETGNGFAQVPFYPAGSDVFDPEGGVWSVPPGDPSYRIYRWVPEGDTTLVLEVARSPLPVTAAEKEEAIDGILASLSRYNVKTVDDSKVPNVKPAVSSMFVSADGDLWVRIPGSAEGATYDVFRRDGERLGTVHTPFAPVSFLSPFVRGDEMWAVARDELDIQYVVRGRIQGAFRDEPLETRSGQGGS